MALFLVPGLNQNLNPFKTTTLMKVFSLNFRTTSGFYNKMFHSEVEGMNRTNVFGIQGPGTFFTWKNSPDTRFRFHDIPVLVNAELNLREKKQPSIF